MRETRAVRQIPPESGTSRKSPLTEQIQNPLSDENIIVAWKRLAASGKTDWRIANIIAREHDVSPRSIEGKIRRLRKAGQIEDNPNKKAKKHRPRDLILATRENMMAQGKCDGTIAREIAEVTGASVGTLKTTISAMIRKGAIPLNPHNQVPATSEEFKWVRQRRKSLQGIGLTDTSISKIIACESRSRNEEAIRRMLWEMVNDSLLERNENKGGKEFEEIVVRRYELMEHGMGDSKIAEKVSKERGKLKPTIGLIIYRAVHNGGCKKNPN
jgi:DNA-binding CsgD family transcriptional regulator